MLQHGPCSFVHAAGYAGPGLDILYILASSLLVSPVLPLYKPCWLYESDQLSSSSTS